MTTEAHEPAPPPAPAPEEPSPAEQLTEAFWALKKRRVRVSASHTTRASEIGEPCERKLYYRRTAGELATPYPKELQAIFDLGKHLEGLVFRDLEDGMGCEIVSRERDYLDREREFTGHGDAKLKMRGWPKALPAEIKGLNPYSAESIETIADIRDSRQGWIRKYYDQLQSYIHFDGAQSGVFVLLNKVSGRITFIDCPRDAERIDHILAKAERVRDAVRAHAEPERFITGDCDRCPFLHICMPDRMAGAGLQIYDSEEVAALIRRKLELKESASEAAAVDRELKKLLPEQDGELLVGDYLVTGKRIQRKAYEVKAGSYITREFVKVGRQ